MLKSHLEGEHMRAKKLRAALAELPDYAEVVVHEYSRGRDHEVNSCRIIPFDACYFGGPEPKSKEQYCLLLDID
jgi:hypothetical protein